MKEYYAPVLITVYDRFDKFKRCINSLKSNVYADKTPLYIAIDFPVSDVSKVGVDKVKEYAQTIVGFKYVNIIVRTKNLGLHMNSKLMMDLVFEKYDKFIRTEDDNVFSPYFLEFMNEALDKYASDQSVFAINAYNYPNSFRQDGEGVDVYRIKEFYPYGYGAWKNKFNDVDRSMPKFYSYFFNPLNLVAFSKNCHPRVFYGLVASILQRKTYGDYVFSYHVNINDMCCIVPKVSIVRNEGQDGTGMNSGDIEAMQNQAIYLSKVSLEEDNGYFQQHLVNRNIFFNSELGRVKGYKIFGAYLLMCLLKIRNIFKPYKI